MRTYSFKIKIKKQEEVLYKTKASSSTEAIEKLQAFFKTDLLDFEEIKPKSVTEYKPFVHSDQIDKAVEKNEIEKYSKLLNNLWRDQREEEKHQMNKIDRGITKLKQASKKCSYCKKEKDTTKVVKIGNKKVEYVKIA